MKESDHELYESEFGESETVHPIRQDLNRLPIEGKTEPRRQKITNKTNPSEIIYKGHPTILAHPKTILFSILLFAFGIYYSNKTDTDTWWLLALSISVLLLLFTSILRYFRSYYITNSRIELNWGLLIRNSKEARIQDIRAINIHRKGILGILGIGRVEFSTAGSEDVEVVFDNVWRARKIKRLVRSIQDKLS